MKVFDPTVAEDWFELCFYSNIAHIEDYDPKAARQNLLRIGRETVKFRVFVQNNKVVGISNHSTNRPLDYKDHIRDYLKRVADAALTLAKKQALPLKFPANTKKEYYKNNFIMDFGISKEGTPVFIGGYLPHSPGEIWSEDSCCFPSGKVEGLALHLYSEAA